MIDVKIIYEDEHIAVVDKPAGLVMHPGAGEHEETLVDWLLDKYPGLKNHSWPEPDRAGIIHRLDKDTSGLIILAKNPEALQKMQSLFQSKAIQKTYITLVFGKLEKETGEITGAIGRDPNARREQRVTEIHFDWQPGRVREARTVYRLDRTFQYKIKNNNYDLSLIEAQIETGRMHQIRVHFKSIGHPVIGDQTYNIKHSRIVSKALEINRQFLHAKNLKFTNPFTNKPMDLASDLPEDLKLVLEKLS